jgi:hypothetical protein
MGAATAAQAAARIVLRCILVSWMEMEMEMMGADRGVQSDASNIAW